MDMLKRYITWIAAVVAILSLLCSCTEKDIPEPAGHEVPEGMVEIHPVLPGMCAVIPRTAPGDGRAATRTYYPSDEETESLLEDNPVHRLPKGSTVWLIAVNNEGEKKTLEKQSYVVYNPEDNETMSYLVPCEVDDEGNMISRQGTPFYLTEGKTYNFYAISPARKLDEDMQAEGKIGFIIKNGEYFYANDSRFTTTAPKGITVHADNSESVQVVQLNPMINQTAELKFQINSGDANVHDLNIQPSGIQISGLQNDSIVKIPKPDGSIEVKRPGVKWHLPLTKEDEPIELMHSDKDGLFNSYDYVLESKKRVNISVPIIPMYSISKPVIVVFRLKVNGVPTSYEIMLNEKDFKAGYSYGYKGVVSIEDGVDVITWQFVSWEHDVVFPFDTF